MEADRYQTRSRTLHTASVRRRHRCRSRRAAGDRRSTDPALTWLSRCHETLAARPSPRQAPDPGRYAPVDRDTARRLAATMIEYARRIGDQAMIDQVLSWTAWTTGTLA